MRVDEGKYSIAELVDWYRKRELVVNTEYQRGGGLWPSQARSYFIDTIIKSFPFPKVYFHEFVDKQTKRPRREIVDGQQRISSIVDFVDNKFLLGDNAVGLSGKTFNELSEEEQDLFLSYPVSVDVIRNADRPEILQMFRRMNAFTLPLNSPEKRHSEFFGEFKDWVNIILDRYSPLLLNWKVFTSRQIVRMADAEFVADLGLAIEEGIVSTSPKKLQDLYKRYDRNFSRRDKMEEQIARTFDVMLSDLSDVQDTFLVKPHVFHSFMCALIHNRFGLTGAEDMIHITPIGKYYIDRDRALISLKRLAAAHEEKDYGEFREYVQAASGGGNRAPQRSIRIRWICDALQGKFS